MTKEEVFDNIRKEIETLNVTISMLTTTVGELVLKEDGQDHKVAISEIAKMIDSNKREKELLYRVLNDDYNLNFLNGLNFPGSYIEALLPEESENIKENILPDGVVGQISGYNIHQPIMKRNFLVHLPEELGIIESDIMSYSVSRGYICIYVRNNTTCPLIKINNFLRHNEDSCDIEITVKTINVNGEPLYDVLYKIDKMDEPKISGGDYASNEPQIISLRFHISKTTLVEIPID